MRIAILRAVIAAVVFVGKRLNVGAVDVVAAGANENVPAVAGFDTAKPKEVPGVDVAAPETNKFAVRS